MVLNAAFLWCFSDSVLVAPVLCRPQAQSPAAEAHCAFIATPARGERVLGTCPDHIFVTRESETIVTFSCGAGHGHSPFPRGNIITVLSVGILG